jgi:hypothetical protein
LLKLFLLLLICGPEKGRLMKDIYGTMFMGGGVQNALQWP